MVKKTKKQNGGGVPKKGAKGNAGGEPPKRRSSFGSFGSFNRSVISRQRSKSVSGTLSKSVRREVHPFGEPNKVGNQSKKAKDTGYMSVKNMTKKTEDTGYMSVENMAKKKANYMVVDPSRNAIYMNAEAAQKPTDSGYIYTTILPKLTDSEYMTAEAIKQPNSKFDAKTYFSEKGSHDNTFGSRAQRFKKIQTDSLTNEDTYIKLFGPDMGPKILHSFGNKTQNEIKQIQNTLSNKNSQSLTTKQAQDFHNLVIQKEKLKTISINNKQEQLVKYFLEEGNRIKTNGTKKSRRINRLLTADGKLNDNIFKNSVEMQKLFGVAQLGDKAVSIANIKNNKNKNALKRAIQTAILRIKGESEA